MVPFMIQAAGVRDEAEALMLARAGVTHIGLPLRLDFHTPDVDDDGARRIVAAVADWNRRMAEWEDRAGGGRSSGEGRSPGDSPFRPVQTILITYQEKAVDVALLAQSLGVDGVQLHGAFSPEEAAELRRVLPDLVVFKSLVVGRDDVRAEVRAYAPYVHAFLTDTYDPKRGASGATGLTHDWAVSRELVELSPVPVILAGGLTPENVGDAVRTVRPAGVDAHTGLEDETGAKDREKVLRFVQEALCT